MLPLLILGGLAVYFATRPPAAGGSTVTTRNGTTVTLPGLVLPPGYTPTSADTATMRSFLAGTYTVGPESSGSMSAAGRLAKLNETIGYYVSSGSTGGLDAFIQSLG